MIGVAPLLCGGITTFAPLKTHGVSTGHKLAVIGIGGLGHLGIKWGVALGAEVTAISSSNSKEADAKKLGAHHFVASSNNESMESVRGTFDFVLCTMNADNIDWTPYLNLLVPNGKFILVGAPEKPITLNLTPILWGQLSLVGSAIGSPKMIEEMLKLASEKNIVADVQTFPIEQVNEALKGMRDGKPKFRYVLKINN